MLQLRKSSTPINWMFLKLNLFSLNIENAINLCNGIFDLIVGNTQTMMGDELDATIDWELSVKYLWFVTGDDATQTNDALVQPMNLNER